MLSRVSKLGIAALVVLALFSVCPDTWAGSRPYEPGDPYVVLAVEPRQLSGADDYPGMWEYVYDVYGGSRSWLRYVDLRGFPTAEIANLHDGYGGRALYQFWDGRTLGGYPYWGHWLDKEQSPSYWEDTNGDGLSDAWIMPDDPGQDNYAWRSPNLWHTNGWAYAGGWSFQPDPGRVDPDGLHWDGHTVYYRSSLLFTFRLVHPNGPTNDAVEWATYVNSGDEVTGRLVGPAAAHAPEPTALSLLALGGLGARFARRKGRKPRRTAPGAHRLRGQEYIMMKRIGTHRLAPQSARHGSFLERS